MTPQRKANSTYIEKRFRCNGKKTPCTSAVLADFGIFNFHYSQSRKDVISILRRNGWQVRSRKSQAGKVTVSQLQKKVMAGKIDAPYKIMIGVPGHVLLMDANGRIRVDTSARQRDRRIVTGVYSVSRIH